MIKKNDNNKNKTKINYIIVIKLYGRNGLLKMFDKFLVSSRSDIQGLKVGQSLPTNLFHYQKKEEKSVEKVFDGVISL